MSFSELFIRRPIGTSLLAAAVLLAGMAAYFNLPVAPLPRVDFPTIQVQATLPGASPETMASSVAMPLERRFGRIAGVTEITSTSSLSSTSITLQFDLDRDVDAACRDVQAAINAAGGDLPANLPTRPTFKRMNPADSPILIVSLTSDTVPLPQIFDVANSILAQKVAQIRGVGQVMVGGGQQPGVRVQADPQALAGLGMTLADLRNFLSLANVNQPVGGLQQGRQAYSVSVNDQLYHADSYKNLVVAYRGGAPVHLSDVARVIDDVENNRLAAWFNGQRAVLMIIRRQPDANILEVIDRVKAVMPRLAQSISPAIKVDVAIDRATTIRASVGDVEFTLVIAVVLVILVVFAFLRSPAATAVPSVAVPLSLVGTFGLMYLLDYSLDNLSLMALTISTGFVVDDAIVVTENIMRYIELGDDNITAAIKGARQIAFTILSITISLLAVFLPILLMGGVIGRLFREFAVTLSVAIGVSCLVSLTVTPMMSALFLRRTGHGEHGRLYNLSERGFDAMLRWYERGLRWAFAHRRTMLVLTVGAMALNVLLFKITPKGLFPQQDTGMITGISEAAQDVSFVAMKERQEALNDVLVRDPDIAHFVSFIGASNGTAENTGNVFIDLKAKRERHLSADAVIARLRNKVAKIPGVMLYMQASQDIRVGGRSARTQYQYTLQDANLDELKTWAPKVLERFRKLPELRDVATDQQTGGLQATLSIDRDTAARLGVTPSVIDDALYDAFGQRQVSTIYTQLNQNHVVLEILPELQKGVDSLQQLYVASQGQMSASTSGTGSSPTETPSAETAKTGPGNGQPVPLGAITRVSVAPTSLGINHQGQFPSVTISFNLAPNVALGDAVIAMRAAEKNMGLPAGMHGDFAGTAQAFTSSLSTQPVLIMAALVTVYIVLGMLYESLVHPITILSTLPSAGVGALLALLLCKMDLSVIALIGIILLIGIVKKNAIMMVDFAIELERDQGLRPDEAMFQACLLRFRPIMMTTMAALFGSLPLALGSGTGAEIREPLGVAIVGGLVVSQMLTLFTTPIVYLALDRFTRKKRRLEGDRAEPLTA